MGFRKLSEIPEAKGTACHTPTEEFGRAVPIQNLTIG